MKKPGKRVEPFVKVPLWWIEAAAKAAKSPATLVLIELLHERMWRSRRSTFSLANGRLERKGVSRDVKRRVLRDLERAKLIAVERKSGRAPVVSLTAL